MTPIPQPDWQQVQELFHKALDLPADEWRPFLEQACAGNEELVDRVLELLEFDQRPAPLDRSPEALARAAVGVGEAPLAVVGRYRLFHELGRGGMATVFYAEHVDLGTAAAVKILRDAWLSPARHDRFVREGRTLAGLRHPSIARLYDADRLPDGTPFFIMEYVEGSPLTDYCREHRCSLTQRLGIFRAVCEAVRYAHRQAIIHRDLKPSNILVESGRASEEGPRGVPTVKLLDFGISKHLDELDDAVQTQTALRLMTPAYASPEQLVGAPLGVSTDVYSLGVILYELLTGRRPIETGDRSRAQIEPLLRERAYERPSVAFGRALDALRAEGMDIVVSDRAWTDLDVLCLTALHPDPERRYGSVEALMRDVDNFLDGRPLEARPDSWTYRSGKFIRRHRRELILAAFALVALVVLGSFYTVRLSDARDAALAEAARAQRIQNFVTGLFEGGDSEAGPPDTLRVVSLLNRGVEEARVLETEPDVQADLFETLGKIYQQIGDFERSDSLLTEALRQREMLYGPAHPSVARSLVLLGLLRADQALLEEADSLVRAGLETSRMRLPDGHPELSQAIAAYGLVLQARGEYERAINVFEEAARLQARDPDAQAEFSRTLSNLANTHFYAGRYETSDSLNRLALVIDQQLYGRRHPNVASTLVNLGATRFNLGYLEDAESLYRQALEAYMAYHGQDHPITASNMSLLAQTLAAQGRRAEAMQLLQPALAVRERVFGRDHPRVATTLNELGGLSLQEEDLDEAQRYYERAIEIYRTAYDDHHQHIAVVMSNLASVHRARGDMARCEAVLRDVVARFAATLSEDHLQTAIARIKLGRILLQQDKSDEALDELLAGYNALVPQVNPTSTWLQMAESDLAEAYAALGDSSSAAIFRAKLARAAGGDSSSAEAVVDTSSENEG